jgi:hypothetical protein
MQNFLLMVDNHYKTSASSANSNMPPFEDHEIILPPLQVKSFDAKASGLIF